MAQLLVYGGRGVILELDMVNTAAKKNAANGLEAAIVRVLGSRSIVLVGMMGAAGGTLC